MGWLSVAILVSLQKDLNDLKYKVYCYKKFKNIVAKLWKIHSSNFSIFQKIRVWGYGNYDYLPIPTVLSFCIQALGEQQDHQFTFWVVVKNE